MHTVEVATLRLSEPLFAEELEVLAETPEVRLLTLPLPDNFCRNKNIRTCKKYYTKSSKKNL